MLGLPLRLALLVLGVVAIAVTGLVWYADHSLVAGANRQARDEARLAATATVGQLGESDFRAHDPEMADLVTDRVRQLDRRDGDITGIAVYGRSDGRSALQLVARSGSTPDTKLVKAGATTALADGVEHVRGGVANRGRIHRAWNPVRVDAAGEWIGVVVVDHDSSRITADLADSRRRLWLAAALAGFALGGFVLLALQRELFRPLMEMRRVMGQIRGGARGVRIDWSRGDELGMVADDFDGMVEELELAQSELAKFVNRDQLTGLLIRSAFTDRFSGELTRARREGYPITLVAVDIDQLGEINQTHDTDAGDNVIVAVADVIGTCTRPTDVVARGEGGQFIVALVGADATRAAVVVERVRRELRSRVGVGPERTRVTCGFGLAEFPAHAVDQLALERMAEGALGYAQREGRDHAIAFGPAGGYVDALSLAPEDERFEASSGTGSRELSSAIHALARALDGIDPAIGGGAHSQRVARYAIAVARELGWDDGAQRELRSAAVLHDIGKVTADPAVWALPAAERTPEQQGDLDRHAWASRAMIAGAGLGAISEVVFAMPERWDGTGLPERRAGDSIPEASRILHAAELLDELTWGAQARGAEAAAEEVERRSGTELDPEVAIVLAKLLRRGELMLDDAPVAGTTPRGAVEDQRDAA